MSAYVILQGFLLITLLTRKDLERHPEDFGTKRSQVQILSPRPENAGIRKDSGSFFILFAQSAVFGAFFMQRTCNLGKRAKGRWTKILTTIFCSQLKHPAYGYAATWLGACFALFYLRSFLNSFFVDKIRIC